MKSKKFNFILFFLKIEIDDFLNHDLNLIDSTRKLKELIFTILSVYI